MEQTNFQAQKKDFSGLGERLLPPFNGGNQCAFILWFMTVDRFFMGGILTASFQGSLSGTVMGLSTGFIR